MCWGLPWIPPKHYTFVITLSMYFIYNSFEFTVNIMVYVTLFQKCTVHVCVHVVRVKLHITHPHTYILPCQYIHSACIHTYTS